MTAQRGSLIEEIRLLSKREGGGGFMIEKRLLCACDINRPRKLVELAKWLKTMQTKNLIS